MTKNSFIKLADTALNLLGAIAATALLSLSIKDHKVSFDSRYSEIFSLAFISISLSWLISYLLITRLVKIWKSDNQDKENVREDIGEIDRKER